MADPEEVDVLELGAQGDGIARTAAGEVFIPYALPGERWRFVPGNPAEMLRPHAARAPAVCRHFTTCGGCVAQHMPDALYAAWKRRIVVDAFHHRRIDAPVDALVRVPPASRRRLTLYARRYAEGLRLGFYRAATHDIVNVRECPIAMPQLVAALPVVREMLEPLLSGRAEAAITLLATPVGIDAAFTFMHADAQRAGHPRLSALAARHGFARLAIGDDVIMLARPPVLAFGGVHVVPEPGAFVQPVEASEVEMTHQVLAAAGDAKRVADLFCGLGTFTFPLARRARVLAIDSSKPAIAALEAAARRTQGLKPIETRVRDLFRTPLAAKEMKGLDAVVFDPARSGAKAQAEQLGRSDVPTVIAISCNPGTLARDVRILIDGGYALERVTPVDQFLFAAHVEAVAVLRR